MRLVMRDIDIRNSLKSKVLSKHKNDPKTLIVEELGLCQGDARIDVAVVNGELHGIEIKSDRDTLERLPSQVEFYSRVFDKVTLIVGKRYYEEVEPYLPDWWGIKKAEQGSRGGVSLKSKRRPLKNNSVDPFYLVQFLWKPEIIALLEKKGVTRGVKSKPKRVLWEKLAKEYPVKELQYWVRENLKNRSGWRDRSRPK